MLVRSLLRSVLTARSAPRRRRPRALPRPAHVVVVIDENRTFAQVIGNGSAPWLTPRSPRRRALHRRVRRHAPEPAELSRAVRRADERQRRRLPGDRHLASTRPTSPASCSPRGLTFAGYSEGAAAAGFRAARPASTRASTRPGSHFTNVPPQLHQPLTALHVLDALPTVAFIVPDLDRRHARRPTGSATTGRAAHLAASVDWAATHDALVVFTWDEGFDSANSIPTMFVGPMVRPAATPNGSITTACCARSKTCTASPRPAAPLAPRRSSGSGARSASSRW